MVPLDRALVSSYRLSIVTTSLSAAVWPQFAMHIFQFVETYLFTGTCTNLTENNTNRSTSTSFNTSLVSSIEM